MRPKASLSTMEARYRRLGAMLATGVRYLVPVCQKDGECRDPSISFRGDKIGYSKPSGRPHRTSARLLVGSWS